MTRSGVKVDGQHGDGSAVGRQSLPGTPLLDRPVAAEESGRFVHIPCPLSPLPIPQQGLPRKKLHDTPPKKIPTSPTKKFETPLGKKSA